jgi:hypothetical protein
MPQFTKQKSKLHLQLTNSDQATAQGGQVLVDALCRRFDLWKRVQNEPSHTGANASLKQPILRGFCRSNFGMEPAGSVVLAEAPPPSLNFALASLSPIMSRELR